MKTSRRPKRRRIGPEPEENIFNPFAPVISGFNRWKKRNRTESGGSFRDAFITVLLLHVIAVLGIMAYSSFKKAATAPKTAKQSERQVHEGPDLADILRKNPQEIIPTRDAIPGEELVRVKDKDPYVTNAESTADSKQGKTPARVAKVDEPLPPLVSPVAKSTTRPAIERPAEVQAKVGKNEATKKAFLDAKRQSSQAQTAAATTEPEVRQAEPAVMQVATPPAPAPTQVVVGNGDNIYTVSKRLNVSYAELAKANNIASPRDLRVGQTLVVPQRGSL